MPQSKVLQTLMGFEPGLRPSRFRASQPEFVCVKQDTINRYPYLSRDPYKVCESSNSFGLWLLRFKYVFICERFFTLKISPVGPPTRNCPRVIDNEFERKGYLLADYQKYLLIHELVHFYLGQSSLGFNTNPPEMYRLNECVNMDAKNSLNNPMNYQYFIAMVEQGCTDAPDPFQPPFPLPPKALREESVNQTSPGTIDLY
ncbi:MAG: hypothetical protein Q9222_000982 [Ikaeria aurantiellina]